jgi:hypothetical protein
LILTVAAAMVLAERRSSRASPALAWRNSRAAKPAAKNATSMPGLKRVPWLFDFGFDFDLCLVLLVLQTKNRKKNNKRY